MDESVRITVPKTERDQMDHIVNTILQAEQRLRPLIDVYRPESEIARANQIASRSRFPISRDTQRILEIAQRVSQDVGGAFDVSDAPLRHMWRRHLAENPDTLLPDPLVQAARLGVGMNRIHIRSHSLLFDLPDTQLDLNDFARPYLIDLAIVQLRSQGRSHMHLAAQDAGRTLGRSGPNKSWQLPIPHPTEPDRILAHLTLAEGSAYALAGSPAHFTSINDEEVATLINPLTGWPAPGDVMVWTVGPVASEAYALARALFGLAPDERSELITRSTRYQVILIDRQATPRIQVSETLQPFLKWNDAEIDSVEWITANGQDRNL